MKTKLFISIIILLSSIKLFSQNYKTGLGVRLSPYFYCIDVKHFFKEKFAMEGMLNIAQTQVVGVFLAELSNSFKSESGLNWYYGLGGSVRFPKEGSIVAAADGIIGLEYTFTGAPINLSADWKPAIEIVNGSAFYPTGFGLSIRYAFK